MKREYRLLYVVVVVILLFLSFRLLAHGPNDSLYLLHNIDLVFHEAGHPIFRFFGNMAGALGGMFGQLLIPLILTLYFLKEQQFFSACVMTWWFGENFVDLAPYIGDAQTQSLALIGGDHDFAYILGRLGMLQYDLFFEHMFMTIGVSIMALAILFMLVILRKTFKEEHTIMNAS